MTTAQTIDVELYGVVQSDGWWEEGTCKSVLSKLQGLTETQEICLHINSVGGEVPEGIALYNRLKSLPNKKIVIIEGLAASIASIVAMVGDEIHMALGSQIMIHNPATFAYGDADEMSKAAELLEKVKENLIDVYASRVKISRDELAEMMDNETWLNAVEAKEKGFCTSIDESLEMVACVNADKLIVNGLSMPIKALNGLPIDTYTVEEGGENMGTKNTSEPQKALTVEMLMAEHEDIYNAVFEAGVVAERSRLQALDEITNADRAEVINKAKYETFKTANDIAIDLLKNTKSNINVLQNMQQDAESSNTVGAALGTQTNTLPTEIDVAVDLVKKVMKNRKK